MSRHNGEETGVVCAVCGFRGDELVPGHMIDHFKTEHPVQWAQVQLVTKVMEQFQHVDGK